jgi:hypothetical protein
MHINIMQADHGSKGSHHEHDTIFSVISVGSEGFFN